MLHSVTRSPPPTNSLHFVLTKDAQPIWHRYEKTITEKYFASFNGVKITYVYI